ncbi:nuclear transport factor 2 family protein [Nocardioides sp.]|uniref:nuclear transport factor 2 family protein n=1 Tax=Nocardioides sp. TaxID=35761 RepID=UPI002603570B|nr:nuclear transport factor 2 family protein [Nocardioides sp.]
MARPRREQLRRWAADYVRLWNQGDKAAWERNWRSVAPGDFSMYDPVGTPLKRGIEACALAAWDLFQPTVTFEVPDETLFVSDGHVAWVMHNHFEHKGRPTRARSIETFEFGEDGSVLIRTWYDVPSHDHDSMGELYKVYQPTVPDGSPRD